ncbi:MAG: HEAT repeat domain-containing protein [Cyanobacteria bacterium P01_D01_bin.1]
MTKSKKLEIALEQIKTIQDLETLNEGDVVTLRKIINGTQVIAILPIAKLIIRHSLTQLIPDLIVAFHKMLEKGEKTDPGCKAKWAIANTLYQLEQPNADLFLTGIRHTQLEPVWGGTTDTAPPLRSLCALGLVQANYSDVLSELADLLADDEHDARAGAARAVGYSQNPAGIPLLRLKVHFGDTEPQVMSECFVALLQLSAEQAPIVIERLESGSEAERELAAIALGEARIPEAFAAIKRQWQRTRSPELRSSFLLAIATLRTEAAIDFLLGLVERGNQQEATNAIAALEIYRHTPDIWQRVQQKAKINPTL